MGDKREPSKQSAELARLPSQNSGSPSLLLKRGEGGQGDRVLLVFGKLEKQRTDLLALRSCNLATDASVPWRRVMQRGVVG
jgi:hypothetical protein